MKNLLLALLVAFGTFPSLSNADNYQTSETYALERDQQDPLKQLRDQFLIPTDEEGRPLIYFIGNSLGLQPKSTQSLMQEELDAWATKGVEGHFKPNNPWFSYHETVRDSLARLVGAQPDEVVAMNSLTVNLHLMMVSFYQPTETRYKVLMEAPVFSSDTYAVKSQIQLHGYNPDDALIIVSPREGEDALRIEDVEAILENHGHGIAMTLLSGVNYYSGQLLDMPRITKKAHEKGVMVGFDLAHAIGNVPLHLHNWDVDFAAWCSYKYVNAGPGAIGGMYVNEKHAKNPSLRRFAGWWGNDPETRFTLHLQPDFIPALSADGWQLSNPSIFSLVPLRASLQIFDSVNLEALRDKSVKLTGYLLFLIDQIKTDHISIITPRDPQFRGAQLSIRVKDRPEEFMEKLREEGIVSDFRRPDVIRVAPTPLYNTYHEVWRFAEILKNHLDQQD